MVTGVNTINKAGSAAMAPTSTTSSASAAASPTTGSVSSSSDPHQLNGISIIEPTKRGGDNRRVSYSQHLELGALGTLYWEMVNDRWKVVRHAILGALSAFNQRTQTERIKCSKVSHRSIRVEVVVLLTTDPVSVRCPIDRMVEVECQSYHSNRSTSFDEVREITNLAT